MVAQVHNWQAGMRVEINSGGYRDHQPDWEPVRHEVWQGSNNAYRNGPALPPSFLQAFPLAPGEDDVQAPIATVDRLMAWQAASRLP